MAHLTLGVLGPLEILVADQPVTMLESEKARALLAYLAVEADRPHRRDTLVGLLWPDSAENLARGNLRHALYTLRQAIGDSIANPPYLIIQRDQIQFNRASNYALDVALFQANLAASQTHSHPDIEICTYCARLLGQAATWYRGKFLDQFFLKDSSEFEEWALVHRESLHRRALEALEHLTNYHLRHAEFEQAVMFAQRQLELDPWREEAHCQMMRALAAGGQRSAALAQFESCRRVLAEELGVEPSTETKDLVSQIRRGDLNIQVAIDAPTAIQTERPLPVPLTPFVGRERELGQVAELLADERCRLITLVGPGGMGKTRLALEVAAKYGTFFPDGVAFVSLASVSAVESIFPTLAGALEISLQGPTEPRVQLLRFLRGKHMLIVVDNVEHLLEAVGFWTELLRTAPNVKLLLTSREVLSVQDEWVLELEGLPVPENDQVKDVEAYAAAALFLQRARRARVGFELTPQDQRAVVHLCRLVGGMPLALELAATWMRTLSCQEIVQEIEGNLDFLAASVRDLAERHRSMRAVFDYSWQTLSGEEKQVLSRLAVFRGGFQRQAAEKVAGASLTVLSSLVTRSLLRRTTVARYELHELIRQYAASRLAENAGELRATRERHCLYYLSLLEEKDAPIKSQRQMEVVTELTREIDNIQTAWDWAVNHPSIFPLQRVSFTWCYLFALRNSLKEGESTFQRGVQALQANSPDPGAEAIHQIALNMMIAGCGYFRFRLGGAAAAYTLLAPTVAFLPTSVDPSAALYPLWYFGVTCWILGRYAEAKENLEECLRLSLQYGDRWCQFASSTYLGVVAHDQGEYHLAWQYLSRALDIVRQLGDLSMTGIVLRYAGRTKQALGEFNEAEKLLHSSLELARETNHRLGIGQALDSLGQVAFGRGRYDEAQTFFLKGANLFREIGDTTNLSRALNHRGFNSLALHNTTEARRAFHDALKTAQESDIIPISLNALTGIAALDTEVRASPETLGLVLFILQHPAVTAESKDLAVRLRGDLESELTLEEIKVAEQRAGSLKLDELVRQMLEKENT